MAGTVYMHTENNMPLRLTKDIEDMERLNTVYNALYYMGHNGMCFTSNGCFFTLNPHMIYAVDENRKPVETRLDSEWSGAKTDKDAVREKELDRLEQMAAEDGDADLFDRDAVRQNMSVYHVMFMKDDGSQVKFAADTWSEDKANELYNAVKYGIDDSVTLCDKDHTAMDRNKVCLYMGENKVGQEENPEWPQGVLLTDDDIAVIGQNSHCMEK